MLKRPALVLLLDDARRVRAARRLGRPRLWVHPALLLAALAALLLTLTLHLCRPDHEVGLSVGSHAHCHQFFDAQFEISH